MILSAYLKRKGGNGGEREEGRKGRREGRKGRKEGRKEQGREGTAFCFGVYLVTE